MRGESVTAPPLTENLELPPHRKGKSLDGHVVYSGAESVKIHEVWHFSRDSTDLFSGYISTFLKIKQEASGWPSDVGEDPDKRRMYVETYKQTEGIQLDVEKIEKNPGMRSLAKMMLNSFWGKFGVNLGNRATSVKWKPLRHLMPFTS